MRDGLTRAVVAKIDTSLVNPALAAVSNVNPASLTYGVTPIISSGNTADNLREDILSIFDSMIAANLDPRSFVLMTTPTVALSISLMVNSLGTPEFPNMGLAPDGRKHWHPLHPGHTVNPAEDTTRYAMFRQVFESIVAPLEALGVEVLNCSRHSALTCFPRPALEAVL